MLTLLSVYVGVRFSSCFQLQVLGCHDLMLWRSQFQQHEAFMLTDLNSMGNAAVWVLGLLLGLKTRDLKLEPLQVSSSHLV